MATRTAHQPSTSRPASSPQIITIDNEDGPSRKRKRGSDGTSQRSDGRSSGTSFDTKPVVIEDVDEEDTLGIALQKQSEEQVASQEKGAEKLENRMHGHCNICLDEYTDLMAAKCGHVFCNECLEQSLRASERRQGDGKKAQCPICRKTLVRKKKNEVFPVVFMSKEAFLKQKARERALVEERNAI